MLRFLPTGPLAPAPAGSHLSLSLSLSLALSLSLSLPLIVCVCHCVCVCVCVSEYMCIEYVTMYVHVHVHMYSTLASKMEHLADLQRHLEACFHDSKSTTQDSKPASGNTSYTAYYFMRGEDGEPLVNEEDNEAEEGGRGGQTPPRKSSTPKKHSPKSPPKTSERFTREETLGAVPPREAQAQIGALQSELEEVKRWNDALQTRLKESGGTRDVGVGMEKGATAVPSQSPSLAREKYVELESEVDRLLGELEAEKERSQSEREQQETECAALHGELSAARERVGELEQQLRESVMRDAGTSTGETEALNALEEKVEGLQWRLGEAGATAARLKGQLQAEKDDNHQLREEVKEMRRERYQQSPAGGDRAPSVGATASMPNLLLTPDRTPGKTTADSWTSPGVGVGGARGEGLDMRALKQRQEEVTRLNQELQRKCREQLHRSPPSASAAATTSASWQVYTCTCTCTLFTCTLYIRHVHVQLAGGVLYVCMLVF